MFFAFGCILVSGILSVFVPYSFKLIVDTAQSYAPGSDATTLWYAVWIFISASALSAIIWRLSDYGAGTWATGARATARDTLISYLLRHSYGYFSNRFTGSLSSKAGRAASSMRDLSTMALWQLGGFVVTITSSFFLAFVTSPTLSFLFLAWIIVIIPLNLFFGQKRVSYAIAAEAAESKVSGASVDTLGNIVAVHEYARRKFELERLRKLEQERREAGLRNWRYGNGVLLLNAIVQSIFIGGIIIASMYLMTHGSITAGDVVLMLTIIYLVQDRIAFIGQVITNFSETWGVVQEALEDIIVPIEVAEKPGAKPLEIVHASIKFKGVSFDYDGISVLKDFGLAMPKGQKVGLVGRSGAGKSTLMKLLLRHYDVGEGEISIDRQNIREVTKESLREVIAVVPQEPMLFHRSIRDNIAYGKPDASINDVIEAAKAAQAHEFINTLPEAYDSLVGERGVKLSGGQRQRVVLARALLKDAPILLLDEATSSLDSESEAAIQKALLKLMEGRTVIAIAHRLSTLRAMDRLIVMDEGKIIEDGTHEELLQREGVYADLWNHQAGGFITED
jgi:ATP-binding cassette, subfamily B, bacterial